MSADEGDDADDGGGQPGRREVAHRVFAAEFDDATVSYRESDEERAPNYVVTPTGARANRLFAVGVLTEVEPVNDDVVRARIADPTGVFVSYAGQYQPDPLAFFERAEPPAFVALTGKARTFEPDDGDRIYTSVRPESVNAVDADTRDRWVVSAAEATLERVALFEEALAADERGDDLRERLRAAGHREALAAGIPLAIERYGTTPAYLEAVRRTAVEALELVAGDRDAVDGVDLAPDEGGAVSVGPTPEPEPPRDEASADTTTATNEGAGERAAAETDATDAGPSATAAGTDADSTTVGEEGDEATGDATDEATEEVATAAGADATTDEGTTPDADPEAHPDDGSEGAAADAGASAAADAADTSGLGDFDGGSLGEAAGDADEAAAGDGPAADRGADGSASDAPDEEEMYELDDEERREVQEEYGTEFSTGSEVDGPGEADIDAPGSSEGAEPATGDAADASPGADGTPEATSDETPAETGAESETAAATHAGDGVESGSDADGSAAAESAEPDGADAEGDLDLEDAAIATMEDLDDGDGVDREAVVAAVVDEYGADPGAAEDAIQDALMSGRCYEPSEGTLKPI